MASGCRFSSCSFVLVWLINCIFSTNKQYFSLTSNQPTVLLVMVYQLKSPNEQAFVVRKRQHVPIRHLHPHSSFLFGGSDKLSRSGVCVSSTNHQTVETEDKSSRMLTGESRGIIPRFLQWFTPAIRIPHDTPS